VTSEPQLSHMKIFAPELGERPPPYVGAEVFRRGGRLHPGGRYQTMWLPGPNPTRRLATPISLAARRTVAQLWEALPPSRWISTAVRSPLDKDSINQSTAAARLACLLVARGSLPLPADDEPRPLPNFASGAFTMTESDSAKVLGGAQVPMRDD
jgi:hypothetical protein